MANKVRAYKTWLPWGVGGAVIVILAVLWVPMSRIGANPTVVRDWIESLGPLAPVAFVALNVVQIVVAPIPGYPVQALGGVLFGLIRGSVYTLTGLTLGGVLAAWLGRRLGRTWLERRLGRETLESWEQIAHINAFWTWWLILLIPVGDIPYFFAGVSRIRLTRFALAILTSRGPFTVLIVWMGDRAVNLPLTWMGLLVALIALVVIIGFSQAERIEGWARVFIQRSISRRAKSPEKP